MSEIMKIKDESERGRKTETKKKQRGDASYRESVKAKWFCGAFKLGFVQLMSKTSLIFKLSLALLILLKEKELYESKHAAVECKCSKIWDLLSFLISSSILFLKWRQVLPM